jgi:2-keto-4-pentenoate hydratase/2-oxohepta-3-ene-1,7-dioic acid hydratase in catechol pathway
MVHAGRIYETDGMNAVAVHEAVDVRPLSPIPHSPSVRIFRSDLQPDMLGNPDSDEPNYFFFNPSSLAGGSHSLPFPDWSVQLDVLPCVAVVLVADVHRIDVHEADDAVLGYTLLSLLVARDAERRERERGVIGRSHDLGGVLGPVITTPDELEDEVESDAVGRKFALTAALRVNGVERGRGTMDELPLTFAQAISSASYAAPLRAGEIFALGPVATPSEPLFLEPGDSVQIAVDKLGTLALNLASSQ